MLEIPSAKITRRQFSMDGDTKIYFPHRVVLDAISEFRKEYSSMEPMYCNEFGDNRFLNRNSITHMVTDLWLFNGILYGNIKVFDNLMIKRIDGCVIEWFPTYQYELNAGGPRIAKWLQITGVGVKIYES